MKVTLFNLILPCYWSLSTPYGGKISLNLYLMSIDGWIPDIPLEERSPSRHVTR